MYEIKTTLDNGFTFVLDFAEKAEETSEKIEAWKNYYKEKLNMDIDIDIAFTDDSTYNRYNTKSRSYMWTSYDNLDLDDKSIIVEGYIEEHLVA